MTTIQITLPDALAQAAWRAGLLGSDMLTELLRERLAKAQIDTLKSARSVLKVDPILPMSATEIRAEIDASRAEKRARLSPHLEM